MIPEFTQGATFRDLLDPAMEIARQRNHREAVLYVERYAAYLVGQGKSPSHARDVIFGNLGYYAGYYDERTREAVVEVFGAVHPFFGHRDRFGRVAPAPSPDEAFRMGQRFGKRMIEGE